MTRVSQFITKWIYVRFYF